MKGFGSTSISKLVDRGSHAPELYQIEMSKEAIFQGSISKGFPPSVHDWKSKTMKTQREAIGQVWRSLGSMVFTAANSTDAAESQSIMDHVLDILAILHHNDILPDNTYWYSHPMEASSLAETPLLSLLSNEIFAAILDAEWNLFQEDLDEDSKFTSAAQYQLPGFQFSENNNPKRILPYAHSVWLELILCICLKGGWLVDGIAILRQMIEFQDSKRWTAKSWHEMSSSSKTDVYSIPERTVSAELIASYMDVLMRMLDVGTVKPGISAEMTVDAFLELELLLKNANFQVTHQSQLGSRVHFSECNISQTPENTKLVRQLLASSFNKWPERQQSSSVTETDTEQDSNLYVGASIPSGDLHGVLELWHRILAAEIDQDAFVNIKETLATRRLLLQQIATNSAQAGHSYLPKKILIALIERIVSEGKLDLGLETLFLDNGPGGPFILHQAIQNEDLAPILIQYAVKFSDHSLLQSILQSHSKQKLGPLRAPILVALCQCSIEYRKWFGLEHTLDALRSAWPMSEWQGIVLASLAKEILRLHQASIEVATMESIEHDSVKSDLNQATAIFKDLVKIAIDLPERHYHEKAKRQVQTVLGILSSVNADSAALCQPFLTIRGSVHLEQAPEIFRIILSGVVESQGLESTISFWNLWCPSHDFTDLRREREGTVVPTSVRSPKAVPSNLRDAVEIELPDNRIRRYFPHFKVDHAMTRILQNAFPLQFENSGSASRRRNVNAEKTTIY
jgi:hypothetical protein